MREIRMFMSRCEIYQARYKGERTTNLLHEKGARCYIWVINHYVVSTAPHHKEDLYNYHRPSKAPEYLECGGGGGMVNRVAPNKVEHSIDDLVRRGNMPRRKSLLDARPDGGRKQARRLNLERDRPDITRSSRGDRNRWVHIRGRAAHGEERAHCAEHVLIGLVVARAENKFRVGVSVQEPLNNFALVDCDWTDLEVLLAHEH